MKLKSHAHNHFLPFASKRLLSTALEFMMALSIFIVLGLAVAVAHAAEPGKTVEIAPGVSMTMTRLYSNIENLQRYCTSFMWSRL